MTILWGLAIGRMFPSRCPPPALPGRDARPSSHESKGSHVQLPMATARELRVAVCSGNCGKLRELLDGAGGASVVDERIEVMVGEGEKVRATALLEAVAYDQHAAVKLLLEHGANPNLPGSHVGTPLMDAALAGHLHILRTLLDRKGIAIDAVEPETGSTAFHAACLNGHADCAVQLARRGCDMTLRTRNGATGKQLAERKNHTAVLAGLRALVVEQLRAMQQSNDAVIDQRQENSLAAAAAAKQKMNARAKDQLAAQATARELCIAASSGDCGKLRELLESGGASAVDERTEAIAADEAGQKVQVTALYQAVGCDQHATVALLLEHGASPNIADSRGNTPLMQAAARGHLRILRTLLDRKGIAIDAVDPKTGSTAFHFACHYGQAECAAELARRGCDMTLRAKNGQTGKQIAELRKHTAVLERLRALVAKQLTAKQQPKDGSDDQANEDAELQKKVVTKAVTNRKKKDSKKALAQQLSLQPAQVEPELQTAEIQLCIAVEKGDCGKIRELLNGGGVTIVNKRTEATSRETGEKVKVTVLYRAVSYNQQAAVALLLEHGADRNLQTSSGATPLMSAASNGHLHILRMLIEDEVIAIDAAHPKDGATAFHRACDYNHADCAVELVRHGCDTELMDNDNETGWDLAKRHGHEGGVLIRRCKGALKLAVREAQQHIDASAAAVQTLDSVRGTDMDEEQQNKAAKKAAANRKKKDKKKAKKAAAQLSEVEAEPELHTKPEPERRAESESEPEPEADAEVELELAEAEAEAETERQTALELCITASKGDCRKLRKLLDGDGASIVNGRIQATVKATGEKVQTTALYGAVLHGQHAVVELLLERKANPNLADSRGATPLMEAAARGNAAQISRPHPRSQPSCRFLVLQQEGQPPRELR
eukprot:COSAG06_NODE_5448_length_3477_cov_10.886027_1_plen_891_part_01